MWLNQLKYVPREMMTCGIVFLLDPRRSYGFEASLYEQSHVERGRDCICTLQPAMATSTQKRLYNILTRRLLTLWLTATLSHRTASRSGPLIISTAAIYISHLLFAIRTHVRDLESDTLASR